MTFKEDSPRRIGRALLCAPAQILVKKCVNFGQVAMLGAAGQLHNSFEVFGIKDTLVHVYRSTFVPVPGTTE
eukprot:198194-Rhodomonas_salina.1